MSDKSKIEWCDATWNPSTGCTKVSPGCDHCYAETLAERFRGTPGHYFERGFDVQMRPDKLDLPLRWKKPRRVFVNSMSDLFHKDVPDEYIAKVFAVMAETPRHTYQVLTKRHARMRSLMSSAAFHADIVHHAWTIAEDRPSFQADSDATIWPLPNVWLGVSVEDQHWADIRIPVLLETPAAVRFLSCEPLLASVSLSPWTVPNADATRPVIPDLDWVIVGGESGRKARPMDRQWACDLRDQCAAAGVPFLFKQWGAWGPSKAEVDGRLLDGRTWDEYPAVAS